MSDWIFRKHCRSIRSFLLVKTKSYLSYSSVQFSATVTPHKFALGTLNSYHIVFNSQYIASTTLKILCIEAITVRYLFLANYRWRRYINFLAFLTFTYSSTDHAFIIVEFKKRSITEDVNTVEAQHCLTGTTSIS